MFEYRGVEIEIEEFGPEEAVGETDSDGGGWSVTSDKPWFWAKSKYGDSFAINGPDALEGAKRQIDKALDEVD